MRSDVRLERFTGLVARAHQGAQRGRRLCRSWVAFRSSTTCQIRRASVYWAGPRRARWSRRWPAARTPGTLCPVIQPTSAVVKMHVARPCASKAYLVGQSRRTPSSPPYCARRPWAFRSSQRCRGRTADLPSPSTRKGHGAVRASISSSSQTCRAQSVIAHGRARCDAPPARAARCVDALDSAASVVDFSGDTTVGHARRFVGRDHQLGARVEDAVAERLGAEAAEHHRVHRADARAGEHREDQPRGSSAGRCTRGRPRCTP
jgi:hypothetical protein